MTTGSAAAAPRAGRSWWREILDDRVLLVIVASYLLLAGWCGSSRLDTDEFRVIKEPYEMIGGDYTLGYLRNHEWSRALGCAGRSYAFFWTYRPLWSPIIAERDRAAFAEEERRFGYTKPGVTAVQREEVYESRLVVPEPDRFYRNGAGEPLLTAVIRLPGLALVRLLTAKGPDLLSYQFHWPYHPIFLVTRLQGLLGGLATLLLVYLILLRERSRQVARFGAAVLVAFPMTLLYFPNLHYDAVLAPFVLAASWAFLRNRPIVSGICFGLALASKNTAVVMLLAAAMYVAVEAVRMARNRRRTEAFTFARRNATALGAVVAVGILVLTPFANPVSYARELLTPVVPRPFDPRGEDLSRFSIKGVTTPGPGGVEHAVERREVVFAKRLIGYNYSFFIVLIGLPLLWSRMSSELGRYSLWFLLTMFPYRIVMTDGLSTRCLMFLPFAAIVAALVLSRRALVAVLGLLIALDLVFLVDPMTASGLPYMPEATIGERPHGR